MKKKWIFFGGIIHEDFVDIYLGSSQIGLVWRSFLCNLWSFFKVKVQNWDIFGLLKFQLFFWSAWNSWYFFGVNGRCWVRAYVCGKNWSTPPPPPGGTLHERKILLKKNTRMQGPFLKATLVNLINKSNEMLFQKVQQRCKIDLSNKYNIIPSFIIDQSWNTLQLKIIVLSFNPPFEPITALFTFTGLWPTTNIIFFFSGGGGVYHSILWNEAQPLWWAQHAMSQGGVLWSFFGVQIFLISIFLGVSGKWIFWGVWRFCGYFMRVTAKFDYI